MSDLPRVDGVGHRTVRARGVDFHVAEAGSGDDVVLCLRGWPQHFLDALGLERVKLVGHDWGGQRPRVLRPHPG